MPEDESVIGKVHEGKFNRLGFRSWSSWCGNVNRFLDPGHRGVWS